MFLKNDLYISKTKDENKCDDALSKHISGSHLKILKPKEDFFVWKITDICNVKIKK